VAEIPLRFYNIQFMMASRRAADAPSPPLCRPARGVPPVRAAQCVRASRPPKHAAAPCPPSALDSGPIPTRSMHAATPAAASRLLSAAGRGGQQASRLLSAAGRGGQQAGGCSARVELRPDQVVDARHLRRAQLRLNTATDSTPSRVDSPGRAPPARGHLPPLTGHPRYYCPRPRLQGRGRCCCWEVGGAAARPPHHRRRWGGAQPWRQVEGHPRRCCWHLLLSCRACCTAAL
jgi:hypothetical protein